MDRCDGLDSNVEWASVLSLGEQQRLAFARLLLSRPQLALMDESTSALDEGNEVNAVLFARDLELSNKIIYNDSFDKSLMSSVYDLVLLSRITVTCVYLAMCR